MYKIICLCSLILSSVIFNLELTAQDLEVNGSAKITEMDPASSSAQVVGRESDGTLVTIATNSITYAIGDYAHGGVVFWVTPSGKHGRVASLYNILDVAWSNVITEIGASAQSTVNGSGNSIAIVSQTGHTKSAAQHCLDLAFAGYDDWYLPAKNELNQMFTNKASIEATATANGGEAFMVTSYWSSTESETDASEVWNQNFFGTGDQNSDIKTIPGFALRPIRAF